MEYLNMMMISLTWALYAPDSPYSTIMALIIGLEIGSFLNVLIYRLPILWDRRRQARIAKCAGMPVPLYPPFNPVVPHSRCPQCSHRITWWENIPVVSYCLLKGRCHGCRKRIPVRYPVVELLSGLSFLFVFTLQGWSWLTAAAWGAIFLTIAIVGLYFESRCHFRT